MEKTLPVSPTTKTNNFDADASEEISMTANPEALADAGVTILRDSETESAETAPEAASAQVPQSDYFPDYNMGKFTFADEIELAAHESVKIDADPELMESLSSVPQKMAFKIGEVAEMLGVKQYVLRYWETEFEALRPKKSKNNQRVYTRREVETAMLIKKLLYKDRFSIEGARAALKQLRGQVKEERNWKAVAQGQHKVADRLSSLISDIRRLHDSLT